MADGAITMDHPLPASRVTQAGSFLHNTQSNPIPRMLLENRQTSSPRVLALQRLILPQARALRLVASFARQPSGRDQKLVVILSPVTHKVHIRNSLPSDRTSVFGDDYLKWV
jgi:hypothetical protein